MSELFFADAWLFWVLAPLVLVWLAAWVLIPWLAHRRGKASAVRFSNIDALKELQKQGTGFVVTLILPAKGSDHPCKAWVLEH